MTIWIRCPRRNGIVGRVKPMRFGPSGPAREPHRVWPFDAAPCRSPRRRRVVDVKGQPGAPATSAQRCTTPGITPERCWVRLMNEKIVQ